MDDRTWDLLVKINKDQTDTFIKLCNAEGRIKKLEAALNRIAMEDAKLDEPALWLDDDMPLGLFIDMTLGEKKDG
jgi:hypothetical protein